jgi:6-phosphogluconolactonase
VFSSDSRFAYVADIGLDRVYSYRLDAGKRSMAPLDPPYVAQPAGSGPRRLQLNPKDNILYVNRETDSRVSVFAVDKGKLKEIQAISTLPDGFAGSNTTAEILMMGRESFSTSRIAGTAASPFTPIEASGRLSLVEHADSGGRIPRNFSLDPTGGYVLSSNQDTENVVVLRIDPRTGRLSPTGMQVPGQPGSLAFR